MRFLVFLAAVTPTIPLAADPPVDVPSCTHPARVEAHKGPIPGDYVFLKHGSDLKPSALTERYGLTVSGIVFRNGLQGLAVPSLSPADIAKLRCDPDVELITTVSGS